MAAPGKPKPRKVTIEFTGTPKEARMLANVVTHALTVVDSHATVTAEGFDINTAVISATGNHRVAALTG